MWAGVKYSYQMSDFIFLYSSTTGDYDEYILRRARFVHFIAAFFIFFK